LQRNSAEEEVECVLDEGIVQGHSAELERRGERNDLRAGAGRRNEIFHISDGRKREPFENRKESSPATTATAEWQRKSGMEERTTDL
jgi:hypothetical protein